MFLLSAWSSLPGHSVLLLTSSNTVVLPPCVVLAGMLPVEGYFWTDRRLALKRAGIVIFGYRFVVYRFFLIAVFYVERLLPTFYPLQHLVFRPMHLNQR